MRRGDRRERTQPNPSTRLREIGYVWGYFLSLRGRGRSSAAPPGLNRFIDIDFRGLKP